MIVVEQDAVRPCRLVAVALTEAESARAGGALAELSGSAGETDLLVVRNDPARPLRTPEPADAEDYPGDDPGSDPDDSPTTMPVPRVPSGPVRVHRLGLRWTVRDADEPDLVAALSELIGFDPDGDTFCVAPAGAGAAGAPTDPEIEVVRRAVRRVARVYGLPVLPYRPLGALDGIAAGA